MKAIIAALLVCACSSGAFSTAREAGAAGEEAGADVGEAGVGGAAGADSGAVADAGSDADAALPPGCDGAVIVTNDYDWCTKRYDGGLLTYNNPSCLGPLCIIPMHQLKPLYCCP